MSEHLVLRAHSEKLSKAQRLVQNLTVFIISSHTRNCVWNRISNFPQRENSFDHSSVNIYLQLNDVNPTSRRSNPNVNHIVLNWNPK